jgi:hypothetical protein
MHSKNKKTQVTSSAITLGDAGPKVMVISLVVGAVALVFALLLSLVTAGEEGWFRRFSFAYLTSFSFYLTIAVGGLFFVTILHLTRGGWGIVVRRLGEIIGCMTFPMLFLFLPVLIPVLLGSDSVYEWNNAELRTEAIELNEARTPNLLSRKVDFLSPHWFSARCLLYFTIWGAMSWYFYKRSLQQDETGDVRLTFKMENLSTWGMILFAATLAFASFDIQMSLSFEWFSTMYPVYFFASSVLSALCTITLIALLLQRSGRVTDEITVEHYHDLAKLTFAFIFFWGYIAFSQFMLIWYANIPEETFWFRYRMSSGGWITVSLILLFGHLLIPFLGMMARTVRRNKNFLMFSSIYMLVMHWVDCYWLVMPQMNNGGALHLPFVDLLCWVGLGGLFVAGLCWIAGDRPLLPIKDPKLVESLNFKNA